tara:strand:- start:119 stop:1102 length:984 start_codon:yes stop_codon:yes gene_type:complete
VVVLAITWLLWIIFEGSESHLQTTFNPKSDNTESIHDVYMFVWVLAGIVMVGVLTLTMAFSLIFRERPGAPPAQQFHGNTRLEIIWTLIPIFIVVAIAIPSFQVILETEGDPPANSLDIVATGHQWWFEFEYPTENLVTANELHIPVGQPVSIELRSGDVIHSFWIPQLVGKVDMVPGHNNHLWFTPYETGEYWGQCAEYCGTSHANMRFRVIVETQEVYDAWVANQIQEAQPAVSAEAQAGEKIATTLCAACHMIRGTTAAGVLGPDLTHVGSRSHIAAVTMENNAENLSKWIKNPPEVKPGSLMPALALSDEQISQVVAYLQELQ